MTVHDMRFPLAMLLLRGFELSDQGARMGLHNYENSLVPWVNACSAALSKGLHHTADYYRIEVHNIRFGSGQ